MTYKVEDKFEVIASDMFSLNVGDTGSLVSILEDSFYVHFNINHVLKTFAVNFDLCISGYPQTKLKIIREESKMNEINIEVPEGYVIDEANSSFTRIVFKRKEKNKVTCWEDLPNVIGYFVDTGANVCQTMFQYKNVFATKEQAEASIALAMLSQLMKDVNDDWIPDWTNRLTEKYSIRFVAEEVTIRAWSVEQCFLAFPSEEIRDTFLKNHKELIMKARPLL